MCSLSGRRSIGAAQSYSDEPLLGARRGKSRSASGPLRGAADRVSFRPTPPRARAYTVFSYSSSLTMSSALHPEVIRRLEATPQAELPLATEGTLRYVWESRFGPMLIEVAAGTVKVNGQAVEPAHVEHSAAAP